MLERFLRLTGVALSLCLAGTALADEAETRLDPTQLTLRLFQESGAERQSCDRMVNIAEMGLTGLLVCARTSYKDVEQVEAAVEGSLGQWVDAGTVRLADPWKEETIPLFKATRTRVRTALLENDHGHLRVFYEHRKKGRVLVVIPDPLQCDRTCGRVDGQSIDWKSIDWDSAEWTRPEKIPHTAIELRYPRAAGIFRLAAKVKVFSVIRSDGSVTDVCPAESTNPGVGFEDLARITIEQWRFRPAQKNGEPVSVCYRLGINFDPDGED
ncbi:hypothetical protein ABI59_11590 [Acidobacteria bacterium Mor1]|nr:hypothetical protein ABI59_11590 [Acidobacteria bacterium Mor1]